MSIRGRFSLGMIFLARHRPEPAALLARSIVAILSVLLGVCCTPQLLPAQSSQPAEYEVKAAFLYNFAKFVQWPPEAFPSPTAPITICVISDERFQSILGQTLIGKTAQDRPLVVRRLQSPPQDLRQCHIVFVSSAERGTIGDLLTGAKESSVLTVGETDGFAQRGGMVNFVILDNRVRFEINHQSARSSGLRISARLLQLAANVWE